MDAEEIYAMRYNDKVFGHRRALAAVVAAAKAEALEEAAVDWAVLKPRTTGYTVRWLTDRAAAAIEAEKGQTVMSHD